MGLASIAVAGGDHMSALKRYKKILDMDVSRIELPDWKVLPYSESDSGKAELENERAHVRESFEGVQALLPKSNSMSSAASVSMRHWMQSR